MDTVPVFVCVVLSGCSPETRRRLITSPSFAVGWLHLDGPVHLKKEKEVEGEKKIRKEGKRKEIPG